MRDFSIKTRQLKHYGASGNLNMRMLKTLERDNNKKGLYDVHQQKPEHCIMLCYLLNMVLILYYTSNIMSS